MKEGGLIREILLATTQGNTCRLFRQNTGQGWQGRILEHTGARLVLANPRPLHAGLCPGSPDLVGWKTVEITPDMVGQRVAIFTGLEVKTPNARLTKQQGQFLKILREFGGIGEEIRSVDRAVEVMSSNK